MKFYDLRMISPFIFWIKSKITGETIKFESKFECNESSPSFSLHFIHDRIY